MNADTFAQLFGRHLYRPFERIKMSDSEYQETFSILHPGLINLIDNYDTEKMAMLRKNFEASSEFLERDYLYSILHFATCRA